MSEKTPTPSNFRLGLFFFIVIVWAIGVEMGQFFGSGKVCRSYCGEDYLVNNEWRCVCLDIEQKPLNLVKP